MIEPFFSHAAIDLICWSTSFDTLSSSSLLSCPTLSSTLSTPMPPLHVNNLVFSLSPSVSLCLYFSAGILGYVCFLCVIIGPTNMPSFLSAACCRCCCSVISCFFVSAHSPQPVKASFWTCFLGSFFLLRKKPGAAQMSRLGFYMIYIILFIFIFRIILFIDLYFVTC